MFDFFGGRKLLTSCACVVNQNQLFLLSHLLPHGSVSEVTCRRRPGWLVPCHVTLPCGVRSHYFDDIHMMGEIYVHNVHVLLHKQSLYMYIIQVHCMWGNSKSYQCQTQDLSSWRKLSIISASTCACWSTSLEYHGWLVNIIISFLEEGCCACSVHS